MIAQALDSTWSELQDNRVHERGRNQLIRATLRQQRRGLSR